MEIPQLDRSNYLKGLLITARKDRQINEIEISIIKNLATRLGFSSDFFDETIKTLIDNKYITEEPLMFSDKKIAKSFIEDGLRLAHADAKISDNEINWLIETAKSNNIEETWFNKKLKEIQSKPHMFSKFEFALYSLI